MLITTHSPQPLGYTPHINTHLYAQCSHMSHLCTTTPRAYSTHSDTTLTHTTYTCHTHSLHSNHTYATHVTCTETMCWQRSHSAHGAHSQLTQTRTLMFTRTTPALISCTETGRRHGCNFNTRLRCELQQGAGAGGVNGGGMVQSHPYRFSHPALTP